jgi:hypothetical protein
MEGGCVDLIEVLSKHLPGGTEKPTKILRIGRLPANIESEQRSN